MKSVNKLLGLTLLAAGLTSSSVFAGWNTAVSYSNFSDSVGSFDISLSALTVGIGYEIESENKQYTFMPEFKIGSGVDDQNIGYAGLGNQAKIEIDSFMAVSVRGNFKASDNLTLYIQPSYGNAEIKASSNSGSFSDDSWEFGYGAGIQYSFNNNLAIELQYDNYDGTKVTTAGLRYFF